MYSLEKFLERAISAHRWTSFSPEKRGQQMVAEYENVLNRDTDALRSAKVAEETITWYVGKFESLFSDWLSRRSHCLSSMITGPSKFPVERANRANQREQNAYNVFEAWRQRTFKKLTTTPAPKGLDAELEKARRDYSAGVQSLERMKAVNKACRAKDPTSALTELGYSESQANQFMNPQYSYENVGYQQFYLTNTRANNKRLEQRIEILESKAAQRSLQRSGELKEPEGYTTACGGRLWIDYEADRIKIQHESKPSREVIENVKKAGFNWSPSSCCWMRKITPNALFIVRHKFPKPEQQL
jgi:hypothetical protein